MDPAQAALYYAQQTVFWATLSIIFAGAALVLALVAGVYYLWKENYLRNMTDSQVLAWAKAKKDSVR